MFDETRTLRPDVAARYALSDAGHTRIYVLRLGYEIDLCQLTLAEAEALVQHPAGFEWLRPLAGPLVLPETETGTVAVTTAPARAKAKKGA